MECLENKGKNKAKTRQNAARLGTLWGMLHDDIQRDRYRKNRILTFW